MLEKAKNAVIEWGDHKSVFEEFHHGLPKNVTAEWQKAVEQWENDAKEPNPFVRTQSSKSFPL